MDTKNTAESRIGGTYEEGLITGGTGENHEPNLKVRIFHD